MSIYIGENAIRLALGAGTGILVARYLGPQGLGLLGFGVSIFGLLLPFSSLGMRAILVRDFAVGDDWRPFLVAGLSRQLPAALIATVVAASLVIVTRGFEQNAIAIALALMPLPILSLGDTLRALLEAQGQVRRIVTVALVATVLTSGLKIVAIVLESSIWVFALLITLEAAIIAVGLMWGRLKRGVVGSIRYHYSRAVATRLVKESWPLLVGAVAVTLYMKIDITMLGIIAGDTETGIYVAAARLSEVWYFVPVAAVAALRPRLAKIFRDGDHIKYATITQRFLSGSLVVSVIIAGVTVIFAGFLIDLLYGSAYLLASPVLRIHVLAAPFVYLAMASSQWFIDHRLTKAAMIRSSVGAVVNIGLNCVLIPLGGARGAAIATVASYASVVLANGLNPATRRVFRMQLRAFRVAWQ